MPFIPNADCVLTRKSVTYDRYGQPDEVFDSKKVRCAVVTLSLDRELTAVRADSSATRGNARELTVNARLLFQRSVEVKNGDIVDILGIRLKVAGVFPRLDAAGRVDHHQVDLEIFDDDSEDDLLDAG